MITIEQIRAARALIDWSQAELAEQAGLSHAAIAKIENGSNTPTSTTITKITRAFDLAGIEFISDQGVKKKRLELETYSGERGYIDFFNDVYHTTKSTGGDIVISGVDESAFSMVAPDRIENHRKRMEALGNFSMRCLICEGDTNFVSDSYCQYRWTPRNLFEAVPFYVYGDKLALLNFDSEAINIYVISHKKIADSFRKQFSIQWDSALIPDERTDV